MRAVKFAPYGGFEVSFLISSLPASPASMFGTVRSDSRARAESTIWLDDPRMGCDSRAITVSNGRPDTCASLEVGCRLRAFDPPLASRWSLY
jgi:hypothetical protein